MRAGRALSNIAEQYRFHASIGGARLQRWLYLSIYYASWLVLRWGDRHTRALAVLRCLGMSDRRALLNLPDGLLLELDLYTSYDALYPIYEGRIYAPEPGFEPKSGWVVFDLGAQQGIFTCKAAKAVGTQGRVVAFEPHPSNFRLLKENVDRNELRNVTTVEAAVADRIGEADLYLHLHSTGYSLARKSTLGVVRVSLTTLDKTAEELGLQRVDLIKLDIEGSAIPALRGGERLLRRLKPKLAMEFESDRERRELPDWLRGLGYNVRVTAGYLYAD